MLLVFLFGLIVGSFLNVVIVRLHEKSHLGGRSHCPRCRTTIAWYDNIPLVSFILLQGRCRKCKKPIAWQYPLVELATAIAFCLAYYRAGIGVSALMEWSLLPTQWWALAVIVRNWIFISFLIVIFVYDLRWMYILDTVSIPLIIIAFFINFCLGFDWKNLLFGAIIGGGFFLLQFVVSRGTWIGGGDIRLGFAMGLMLGWQGVLVALFLAYITGAAVSLALLAQGQKKLSSRLPFGTFLSAATIVALMYGERLFQWYLNAAHF